MTTPEVVLAARADLGEGPLWDDRSGQLLFVDIPRGQIHAFDPDRSLDHVFDVGGLVGAVALTERGDWLLARDQGFFRFDPGTNALTPIIANVTGRDDVRMNDGYVDARGRFWAGTTSLTGTPAQSCLYRLDADGSVHVMIEGVTTSNGIDWSPDSRLMYFVDTRTGRVDCFDFDLVAGAIANRRAFVAVAAADGRPDGLIVDAAGGIWVALWQGGALRRYTPDGRLDRAIRFPVTLVTKCAFGGPAWRELYVTTASGKLDPDQRAQQPEAGMLFKLRPGEQGKPVHRFAG